MEKLFVLASFYLSLWGILCFFAIIILSFLSCYAGVSKETYLVSLFLFALIAVIMTSRGIFKDYKRHTDFQL
jgi:hypothetical protein